MPIVTNFSKHTHTHTHTHTRTDTNSATAHGEQLVFVQTFVLLYYYTVLADIAPGRLQRNSSEIDSDSMDQQRHRPLIIPTLHTHMHGYILSLGHFASPLGECSQGRSLQPAPPPTCLSRPDPGFLPEITFPCRRAPPRPLRLGGPQ